MKIIQIRNATVIIDYGGVKFLTDPWLGPKDYMEGFDAGINSHIRQPRFELPCPVEKITDVDAVIVTHVHPDHWDEFAANALDKNKKMFVQSEFDRDFMVSSGFRDVEIVNTEGTMFNGVRLHKTSGQHGRREVIEPLCRSVNMPYDAMGVVLRADNEKTLYLAGDTIWCGEAEDAIEKFHPDVIVINACGATLLNGEHIIMNMADVLEVINKAPYASVVASHMDNVSHLSVTREDLKTLAKEKNLKNLFIPEDGESIVF